MARSLSAGRLVLLEDASSLEVEGIFLTPSTYVVPGLQLVPGVLSRCTRMSRSTGSNVEGRVSIALSFLACQCTSVGGNGSQAREHVIRGAQY